VPESIIDGGPVIDARTPGKPVSLQIPDLVTRGVSRVGSGTARGADHYLWPAPLSALSYSLADFMRS
ncbi:hypothetical protein ABZ726_29770, partial [Streptomyces hundungensis]|uniref:hypothetical protein n=1 Tax=Streptomyces hundungensis TaxID=1077946 RepID=UPI00340009BD